MEWGTIELRAGVWIWALCTRESTSQIGTSRTPPHPPRPLEGCKALHTTGAFIMRFKTFQNPGLERRQKLLAGQRTLRLEVCALKVRPKTSQPPKCFESKKSPRTDWFSATPPPHSFGRRPLPGCRLPRVKLISSSRFSMAFRSAGERPGAAATNTEGSAAARGQHRPSAKTGFPSVQRKADWSHSGSPAYRPGGGGN